MGRQPAGGNSRWDGKHIGWPRCNRGLAGGLGRRGMYLDLCGRRVPFQALESSSFTGFLSSYAPQLLPRVPWRDVPEAGGIAAALPHATTIVAAVCNEGVVLASDRRATAGSMISK